MRIERVQQPSSSASAKTGRGADVHAEPPSIDSFRALASDTLKDKGIARGPALIELTAIVLAEKQLRGASSEALATQGWVAARAAAAGILSPPLAAVLQGVDPNVLMRFEEVQGDNRMRFVARGVDELSAAYKAADLSAADVDGLLWQGIHTEEERATLGAALDDLRGMVGAKRVAALLKRLQIATVLGQLGDRDKPQNVAGIAKNNTIALERSLLKSPDKLRQKLYHEFGHLVDVQLGRGNWGSHAADSPFNTNSKGTTALASDYGRRNPHEDFAECHALLLEQWAQIQENPALFVHARGELGTKLAWILDKAYGVQLPACPPQVTSTLQAVEKGSSPFGWRDAQGELHDAAEGYHAELNGWLTGSGEADSPRRRWLVEALSGQGPQAAEAASAETGWNCLQQARALEWDPQQNWSEIRLKQAELRQQLGAQLAAGGEGLAEEIREHIAELSSPSERDRLGYRLDRAWSEVRLDGLAPRFRHPLDL